MKNRKQKMYFASLAVLLVFSLLTTGVAHAAWGEFILKWGSSGTANGQFNSPSGVAVDSEGDIFVADSNNDRVQKFNSNGTFLGGIGSFGTGDGEFNNPFGIDVDSAGNVYVSDRLNDRVQVFDSGGIFVRKWGTNGSGDGQFDAPSGLSLDNAGNVYVADTNNDRIQVFDSSGTFARKWGSSGSGDGEFSSPVGVAVDSSGNVYIADSGNDRIQVFDSNGTFLRKWGTTGSGDGAFNSPRDVSFDSAGYVYITDTMNQRVQVFDSNGVFLYKWGTSGTGDGQFNSPLGIAIDIADNIYVGDYTNANIQRFEGTGLANDFVITVKTDNTGDSSNTEFTIPTVGAGYNYNVDCNNDGTLETLTPATGNYTCDYGATGLNTGAGTYTIRISDASGLGTGFPAIYFNNSGDKEKILTVEQWGTGTWTTMENAFYGCANLTVPASDAPDLSSVTNMRYMFANASSFNQDISAWDVSNVGDMRYLFWGASSFNQNIGNWNTANVWTMSGVFAGASAFNQDISDWNTSSLTSTYNMFSGASDFDQDLLTDGDSWDTSLVDNMGYMFANASDFDGDISNWDTSAVTNMRGMFSNASSFDQNITGWNTAIVEDMSSMFYGASAFDQAISTDGDKWNTAAVLDMNNMFNGAASFDQNIGNWDTAAVTDMSEMFDSAVAFDQDISSWNTAAVMDMSEMFRDATSFDHAISTNGNNWNTADVTDMTHMFNGATSFNQDISNWDTSSVTIMNAMFQGATAFDQNIGTWDVTALADASSMFYQTELSTANYDALLNGWAAQSVKSDVTLNAGSSRYCTGESARGTLVNTYTWSISDLGKDPTCPDPEIRMSHSKTAYYSSDGGTDRLGNQSVSTIDLSYIIENIGTFGQLDVTDVTVSNLVNVSNFSYNIGDFPLNIAPSANATLDISFDIDALGDFSFDMDIINNDSDENPFDLTISGTRTSGNEDFVITVKTDNTGDSSDTQFTIPTTGSSYSYNVDCNNDGIVEYINVASDATCQYGPGFLNTGAGTYTIRIKDASGLGTGFPRIYFNDTGDKDKLLTIEQWGTGKWDSMGAAFMGCSNLIGQATDTPDLSGVTDMSLMFAGATIFNQDIGNWNTQTITNMAGTFGDTTTFNQDIGSWNMGSVMNTSYMFDGARAFNQDLSSWNTEKITDMGYMFNDAISFNQDLGGWDVTALTNGVNMFAGVTLSTANYDALLAGWNAQGLQTGVNFHAGESRYCTAETAYNNLTDLSGHNWTITDGGMYCPDLEDPALRWTSALDYNHGWRVSDHPRMFADVDGDGDEDVVGFGLDGIYVALSDGSSFEANATRWTEAFDYNHGWRVSDHPRMFADVDGDGDDDAVGFGLDGIYVALSDGSSFAVNATKWTSALDYSHGWRVSDHPRMFADVNGDGMADAVGFGLDGIYVALSNGSSFAADATKWTSAFDYNHGWRVSDHPRMFADVDGDGDDDAVGFGLDGIYVALSDGSSFAANATRWTTAFDYNHGWRVSDHPRMFADVDGDGMEDAVGFGLDGIYVAMSTGTALEPNPTRATTALDYSHGWRVSDHPRMFADVNGDGMFDAAGFGLDGVYIALSQ